MALTTFRRYRVMVTKNMIAGLAVITNPVANYRKRNSVRPTPEELRQAARELLAMDLEALQKLARRKGILIICSECPELLTAEELREAIELNIKEPTCNDCYADLISCKTEEDRHPDDHIRRFQCR